MEDFDPLFSIAKLLSRNEAVLAHGRRVAHIACGIAQKMKYCDKGIKFIRFAAITHDIGKIQLPQEVINKPSALNEEELALIKKHPEIGYRLLQILKAESIAAEVALQHHERMDGSGYPFGLKKREINPVARIIAVSDVVDTIVSPQVYKPAFSIDDAICEMKEHDGLLYDSEVVAATLAVIRKKGFRLHNS
jgi:putative nucleotidyltransferase with HDIG domain